MLLRHVYIGITTCYGCTLYLKLTQKNYGNPSQSYHRFMLKTKPVLVPIILLLLLLMLGISIYSNKHNATANNHTTNNTIPAKPIKQLKALLRAKQLKAFVYKKKNYDTTYCFIINMAIPSGSKRMYVIDLKQDSIVYSCLVAHGSGSNTAKGAFAFNNTVNSLATAQGKYSIGHSYYGNFGLAYKLHGLDATNSNAYSRYIVLHAHSCVPSNEVAYSICNSWGCPTVNSYSLTKLTQYINQCTLPIIMDINYMP